VSAVPATAPAGALVAANDLYKYFPIHAGLLSRHVADVRAVDGVSFSIAAGETLGLVGESGSGKTTIGRLLLRLLPVTKGQISFDGHDVIGLDRHQIRVLRRSMQIIFQDPFASLNPRMTVGEIVAEPLRIHGLARGKGVDERVVELLGLVGLQAYHANRYPHEFSGGQRQRIAVARALVLEPTFIVLDEPTSALDMLIQAQIVDLLRDLQKRRNLTYMFISHDLRVVAALASRVLVMRHGKVVEEGAACDLFNNPVSQYTRALFAAAFNLEAAGGDAVAQ
jgi:microcin C transport system ATP-binding protein